jgi:cytochrome b
LTLNTASDFVKREHDIASPATVAAVAPLAAVRVWDGPTRLVHWLLVFLVCFSWWSAEYGHMLYHRYGGITLLGVLVFRLYWGLLGSSTARFAQFVKGPRALWQYLRSRGHDPAVGHNPLGALSVIALLGLLLAQVGLGLFSVDVDGLESGPLSHLVTFETGRDCAHLHRLGFVVLEIFVPVHLLAVLSYWIFRRDNLVRPMITGWKTWHRHPVPQLRFAPRRLAVLGFVLAAGLVWLLA